MNEIRTQLGKMLVELMAPEKHAEWRYTYHRDPKQHDYLRHMKTDTCWSLDPIAGLDNIHSSCFPAAERAALAVHAQKLVAEIQRQRQIKDDDIMATAREHNRRRIRKEMLAKILGV